MSTRNTPRKRHSLDMIESALWRGGLGRREFVKLAIASGVSAGAAEASAGHIVQVQDNQREKNASLKASYDFIVCGAGSSGSVVARRLAENKDVQVLLLEAGGGDDSPSILSPLQWYLNIQSERDWRYMTEPSTALNGRSIPMPMGKALGGGSSINAMVWARGHRNDFERWAKAAQDPKWGYDHVLGIYRPATLRRLELGAGDLVDGRNFDQARLQVRGRKRRLALPVGHRRQVGVEPPRNRREPSFTRCWQEFSGEIQRFARVVAGRQGLVGLPHACREQRMIRRIEDWQGATDAKRRGKGGFVWVAIAPGLVRPVSRGHLRLRTDHPDDPIAVFANLMQEPADMAAMMRGVELARDIGNSAAMKDFVKREVGPGPVKGADLENFIRNATTSFCHASCTCPMGHDDMAVVDNELRVHGMTNLRIADASIMPDITTGNTMAPSVIIGERMAEILAAR